ncbi:unnamed protein product [Linum trigynum]|uniref:Uncharacterized protein n=1 Tax=Linum trigynum TaxID=586398 RepID=A0AAV2CFU5_9ROSI
MIAAEIEAIINPAIMMGNEMGSAEIPNESVARERKNPNLIDSLTGADETSPSGLRFVGGEADGKRERKEGQDSQGVKGRATNSVPAKGAQARAGFASAVGDSRII